MKIFKGVKNHHKDIQAIIKNAAELVSQENYVKAGEELAKMETFIVEFAVPAKRK